MPLADLLTDPKRRVAVLFCLPSAALLGVLIGWPILHGILLSFQRVTPTAPPGWVGTHNYESVLSDGSFWHTVTVTLTFSLLALTIEFSLGLGLALMLARVI